MGHVGKTSSGTKPWTEQWGWFFLVVGVFVLLYFYSIREKSRSYHETWVKLKELEKEKDEALKMQADLQLQIQSQSDPAWVEMVLKRNLGMVGEGEVKVYFHSE